MKFIVELIICKVLKKRIIKYCISQLLESFLKHYYDFIHDQQIEDSVYHYHYEAIIEFIDSLGENYANLDEKEKQAAFEEIRLMKENPHPFIVKVIDDFLDNSGHLCLVQELYSESDFSKFLKERGQK